jgi:PAS domain S-box-containing protein
MADVRPVVRIDSSAWLSTYAAACVRDFFALCEASDEALTRCARALERAGGPIPGGIEHLAEDAAAWLACASLGDWRPLELNLRGLGLRYARAGLPLSAWHGIVKLFSNHLSERAVEAHAGEPARLTGVLIAANEFAERVLTAIADGYYTAKQQREREVTRRHRRLIDAALDAVFEIDEDDSILELNPAAEAMFGHRPAAVLGRSFTETVIPEHLRGKHRAELARLLADDDGDARARRIERRAIRADGAELVVELTLVITERLDGNRSWIAFVRDLTEQKRAEESVALHAHALEQAQFGIVVSDPVSLEIKSVNPAYARLVGYEPAELLGTGVQLIADESRAAVAEIASVLADQGHHTYEVRLRRKDGTSVPVLASSSTIKAPSGRTLRISTVVDITERTQLEEARAVAKDALERSAARIATVSSIGQEFAASSADITGILSLVARRLGEILGDGCAVRLISGDGAWLEPSASFYHPDPELREVAGQILGSVRQRVGDGVAGIVAATGEAFLIPETDAAKFQAITSPTFRAMFDRIAIASALALPLRSRGRTIGVISLLRGTPGRPYTLDDQRLAQDLADRAGMAIDNAVLVATLEQRVSERTSALEAANRDLEAFSYSVSHDLRTPLRAIDGFSRALLADHEAVLDDQGRHFLSRIRAGTQRMAGLIDDLLDLARITSAALTPAELDLSAIAAEVVAELQRREPARRVPVHITGGLTARADARLIRIALENLFGNAWKFTARHPDAQIWFGGDDGTFHVRDTGAGFDMAYAHKLFLPFQRLHAAKEYEGTGVGLATVSRIIHHHGGRIWAESEVGSGATFWFTLGDRDGRAN